MTDRAPSHEDIEQFADRMALSTTRLRMISDQTRQLGQDATVEVFGHSLVVDALRDVTAKLADSVAHRADVIEDQAHAVVAEMRAAAAQPSDEGRHE